MISSECIYERSPNILININNNNNQNNNNQNKKSLKKVQKNNYQHSLNTNIFDPFNFSPPNEFKIKLYSRIYAYEKQN
jgi:hypothetical protein